MKKILIFITGVLMFSQQALALTMDDNGNLINDVGATMTRNEYELLKTKFFDSTIRNLPQESINFYIDNLEDIELKNVYSVSTDKIDNSGNIIETNTITVTEEEALEIKNNDNMHVLSDNKLYDLSNQCITKTTSDESWYYSTSMKRIQMTYNAINGGAAFEGIVEVEWYDEPLIKQYDVLAVRWDESVPKSNILDYVATQEGYDSSGNRVGYQSYSLDGTNMKRTTYGIGQSMNLFNDAVTYQISMRFDMESDVGDIMYGTYQHARHSSANTLAISQSYTFSNSGLGNVLYYSNSTYRSYYDGMQGVSSELGTKNFN